MFWLIVLGAVAALAAFGAVVDFRDRRAGHRVRSGGDIGRDVREGKQADRAGRREARKRMRAARGFARGRTRR